MSVTDMSAQPPWRCEGLFSDHYLLNRLADPRSEIWPAEHETDSALAAAKALYKRSAFALAKHGNEEDCESRFVSPLLAALGYGFTNRKRIPDSGTLLLPDYLLYPSTEKAESAFQSGAYYTNATGLLEAKRWGRNLSEDSSGRGRAARGRSPHYQIRDYLAESGSLNWGVLTNGKEWRLYCKHERASAFLAFDLDAVLADPDEEQGRRWFRFFYALFRRQAFTPDDAGRSPLDSAREGAIHFREEVERDLRYQVYVCVETLAQGLLDNPANRLTGEDLEAVYENALILLYRILFALNAEARGLLPTRPANSRSREYYFAYGLQHVRDRLRTEAGQAEYDSDAVYTLSARLRALFGLINGKAADTPGRDENEELDIPRYNGGLFAPDRHRALESWEIADRYLARVLRLLSYRGEDATDPVAFDYVNLGERHLGSIYEGLLEHRLVLKDGLVALVNDRGERRTTGAYYTPQAWVAHIVEGTLTPLLDEVEASADVQRDDSGEVMANDSFGLRALELNICDPAMGSGHFLVEAVSFLADAIAAHPTTVPRPELNSDGSSRKKSDGSGELLCTQEARLAYWRRRVVESCVYGVDKNRLAVELAKLSLWLKTVDRVPLNFLDHHLRCGNSLVGTDLSRLPLFPEPAKTVKTRKGTPVQLPMTFAADLQDALQQAVAGIHAIESVPTDTLTAAKDKEDIWRRVCDQVLPRFLDLADLWVAPWYGGSITWVAFTTALDRPDHARRYRQEQDPALADADPFHWELAFPEVFYEANGERKKRAGFDAVIGNPPWERIKLQENEFFAERSPEIAQCTRAADRRRLVSGLAKADPDLWDTYQQAALRAERMLAFSHRSGFYPLMGRGDTNYYALFAEKAMQLIHPGGRVGLLVPSGIATDSTTQNYFRKLVTERRLVELLDFENRLGVFPAVHRSFKFSILLFSGADSPSESARCAFFLHSMDDLKDPERTIPLTPDDFALLNPNTFTCPVFRRRRDADLTRRIYEAAPVLIHSPGPSEPHSPLVASASSDAVNSWGVGFLRMFDMTNDSGLFRSADWLEQQGFWRSEHNTWSRAAERYVPLYEGKMVQMYDHRAAGVKVNVNNVHRPGQEDPATPEQHADPAWLPTPQFWVDESLVRLAVSRTPPAIVAGYVKRDADSVRLELTAWAAGWLYNHGRMADAANLTAGLLRIGALSRGAAAALKSGFGAERVRALEESYTLSEIEAESILRQPESGDWLGLAEPFLRSRCPLWLLGFKEITAPTNVRTVIASAFPPVAFGNKIPLLLLPEKLQRQYGPCLLANLNSLALDYAARQKVGGQTLNFFIVEQFPVLPPGRYSQLWHGVDLAEFVRRRVLELSYTAHDMRGFAEDLGYTGAPYAWDEERRLHLRCQLDALYFHLYGLSRDESAEIMDTFPIVRREDHSRYAGRFRTKDLILNYHSAYAAGDMNAWVHA